MRLLDRDLPRYEASVDIITVRELLRLVTLMSGVYINLRLFIPRFFDRDKYKKFIVSNIILVAGLSLLTVETGYLLMPEDYLSHSGHQHFIWIALHISMFITISSLLHFTKQWVQHKDISLNIKELEKEKLETELDSLKAQINPHFLFNTLNNIYSLSLVKSEEAPDVILRLADLMRYIIYDCKDETVSLKEEVEFVKNYVNLEKLRLQEHIDINFSTDIENENKKIAPLLFIPLIENAFKHSNRDSSKALINIYIEENDSQGVKLLIENTKDRDINPRDNKYGGLGISNVKKRLELIYPGKHSLIIKDKEDFFIASMERDI